jgi:hypothetical protein
MARSTYDLETLFIEKLTEKFKLNERDLKRAFAQYDTDGNGLLNLNEMVGAIGKYLNGISRSEVEALVKYYDVNGDGNVSFEEFYGFLSKRSAVPRETSSAKPSKARKPRGDEEVDVAPIRHPPRERPQPGEAERNRDVPAARRHEDNLGLERLSLDEPREPARRNVPREVGDKQYRNNAGQGLARQAWADNDVDARSDMSSRFDAGNAHDVIIRAKRFVQSVRALIMKRSFLERSREKSVEKLTGQRNAIAEKMSRLYINEIFEPYIYTDDTNRVSGVKFDDFLR